VRVLPGRDKILIGISDFGGVAMDEETRASTV